MGTGVYRQLDEIEAVSKRNQESNAPKRYFHCLRTSMTGVETEVPTADLGNDERDARETPLVYCSCSHGVSPIGYVLQLDALLVVFRGLAEEVFARLRLERPTWAFPPREETRRTPARVSDRRRGS